MTYECKFALGDRVIIDGDERLTVIVTAVSFRKTGCKLEVSYFSDHGLQEVWIDEWRLEKVNA